MRFSVEEVEIGPFLVDLTTGRMRRDGIELSLRPQAFRVLKTLIQNREQYVDYDRMIAGAWNGIVVSPHTVDVTVGELKKVLGEFGSWITHRPKVGYRLEVPKSDALVRKGWHFWNFRTREGFDKAIDTFQQAAQEDGTDFRAYEGLAASYLTLGTYGIGAPLQLYPLFMESYSRATALTGGTPELRSHRAHALHMFERRFAQAESQLLQIESEKPSLTRVYQLLAMLYVSMGRFDDALESLDRGYKVDPLWPVLPAVELSVRFFAHDFEAAVACGRKTVELHPYVHVGRFFYALSLEYSGRIEEALREYRRAFGFLPGIVWPRALEAICLTKLGKHSEAEAILADIENIRLTEYVDSCYFGFVYEALGMRDRAFQELERAYQEDSVTLCLTDVDPRLDSLRKDVRFAELRRKVFSQAESFSPSDSSRTLSAPA